MEYTRWLQVLRSEINQEREEEVHRCVNLNRGVRAGLTEGITCESRLEGGTGESHGDIGGTAFQAEGSAGAKALGQDWTSVRWGLSCSWLHPQQLESQLAHNGV